MRWLDDARWLERRGVELAVEFGHGKVVAGLMKRSAKGIEVLGVGAPADLDAAAARLG